MLRKVSLMAAAIAGMVLAPATTNASSTLTATYVTSDAGGACSQSTVPTANVAIAGAECDFAVPSGTATVTLAINDVSGPGEGVTYTWAAADGSDIAYGRFCNGAVLTPPAGASVLRAYIDGRLTGPNCGFATEGTLTVTES
jgi:hypothetical protein